MTTEQNPRRPLRLWPGVAAVALQWLLWFVVPIVAPQFGFYAMLGALATTVLVVGWWLFFSRAPWSERLGVLLVMAIAGFAMWPFLHESIRGGMMGWMFIIFSIPFVTLALVVWAVLSRRFSGALRLASMAAVFLMGYGALAVVRTGGISGGGRSDLHWRWTKTPEERLLAQGRDEELPPTVPPSAPGATATPERSAATAPEKPGAAAPAKPIEKAAVEPTRTTGPADVKTDVKKEAAWPGFRGPKRDSVVRGVRIETDWSAKPPVELWRRPIGPGWSSFAVDGDFMYTQEQRGEEELVSCYRLSTGEPVWKHRDPVRFYESNGGPGPRATPTVHNGRVYAMGATGIVNVLDARTGAPIWSRNAAADTGASMPGWGFTASPLVVNDTVIAAASGRLVGYDAATGHPRWSHKTGGGGYSSPHLVTIDGVVQVLLLAGNGATSVAPADGTRLWQHVWEGGVAIVQPGLASDRDVLVAVGDSMGGFGLRRLTVARGPTGWSLEERWTSRGLKPYFNDSVVHEGHAFGFDGSILSSINLADGERKWKGGRYGHGQMILLPDSDVLLVISEEGELALVSATPDKYTEIARFKAIEGKTWNHPVLVGDVLVVRNGEEMAAFQLPLAGPSRDGSH